jgi:L-fuconolactonase
MTASSSRPAKPRHIPVREDWLALTTEDVVDPDLPIIDAHHHLWDKPGSLYRASEMVADLDCGHRIVGTVFAEGRCHFRPDGPEAFRPVGETETVVEWVEAQPASGIAAGIVGYVDLTLGQQAGEVLDAHVEAGRGRFKGVRGTTAWHADPDARGSILAPPPGLLYDPGFRAGLRELAARKLVFDAWMYHTQLGELADLAHAMPDLAIVLNHQGGPIGIGPYEGRGGEVMADWKHFMGRLARFPNISVKLGGFGMTMAGFDFHERERPVGSSELARGWGAYMLAAIELFGPARCMFESNFPVDKGTTSYRLLWNAFKTMTSAFSASERRALFFETANRVYCLGLTDRA